MSGKLGNYNHSLVLLLLYNVLILLIHQGPRRFGGQVAFRLINLGTMGVTEFVPEMANTDSAEFGMVADVVQTQVSMMLFGCIPVILAI